MSDTPKVIIRYTCGTCMFQSTSRADFDFGHDCAAFTLRSAVAADDYTPSTRPGDVIERILVVVMCHQMFDGDEDVCRQVIKMADTVLDSDVDIDKIKRVAGYAIQTSDPTTAMFAGTALKAVRQICEVRLGVSQTSPSNYII